MRFSISTSLLLIVTGFVVVSAHAAEHPIPNEVVIYKTVAGRNSDGSTSEDVALQIHIFNPKDHKKTDNRSAIVFFFSGGWNIGSPTQFFPHCDYFASRGMVAISAEYRVKSRHNTSPRECVKDAKSAIRWIRQHAKELGIDPDKLAASGGSAGGHIAAAAATVEGFNEEGEDQSISCIPNALVLFNPAVDNGPKFVDDTPKNLQERTRAGWGYGRVREYWRGFSPMHNIQEKTPPAIIFLGAEDIYIPTSVVVEFKQRMQNMGLRCDLHIYKDRRHEFYNFSDSRKYYMATVIEADKFLASLAYVQGEPTLQSELNTSSGKQP